MSDYHIRPIHYLGSKLRILDDIGKVVEELDPECGRLCDLFSGSGTVSGFFRNSRPVTSIDIQEYSRILCSSLLQGGMDVDNPAIDAILNSEEHDVAGSPFESLISYEEEALDSLNEGDPSDMYNLIEHGSVITAVRNGIRDNGRLGRALRIAISKLEEMQLLCKPEYSISTLYGGLYFSFKQSFEMDCFRTEIRPLDNLSKNALLASVMGAASDIVNTVGKQFAQPLRVINADGTLKTSLSSKIIGDRSESFTTHFQSWVSEYAHLERTSLNHQSYCGDYCEIMDSLPDDSFTVIYADPPYTRYHYSRYYHILETIARDDCPEITTTFKGKPEVSRGIYRSDRYQSPFCIQSQANKAFEKLFGTVSRFDSSFVLSYSPFTNKDEMTPRMMTIDQLVGMAKKYYNKVELRDAGHIAHSRLNSKENNHAIDYNAERLIVCTND